MGMFDKDKLYGGERLDKWCDEGDSFILWDAVVLPELVPTSVGDALRTKLTVSALDAPDNKTDVFTLASAIAEKAKDAEPSDFPAIVKYEKVPGGYGTDAAVVSFVEPYAT